MRKPSARTAMTAADSAPTDDTPTVYIAPLRKMIATAIMIAATMLVVLDQTIANVALPHMRAALGATPESINWVLTSYIMATAVGIPMTGWLTGRFGRTKLFAVCIIGFTASSMLCGVAISLPMMVASRLAQGFFGAFLMPMAQAFLYDMNPPSQQVRAITIWGFATMFGPIMGPVVGGWLTDAFNWRWVFFINVPIGLVAAIGIFVSLPPFPAVRRRFDHVGFAMIVVALCGLQLALDRGTQQDWFHSPEILIELGLSISAFWMLIFHLRRAANPIIATALFANRNFVAALLLASILLPVILAGNALLPVLLVNLLDYPVYLAGLMLIPRGVSLSIGVLLGGQLLRRIDGRLQIAIGVLLVLCSLMLQTGMNLEMDSSIIIWSGMFQGLGVGLAVTVLNYTAIATAPVALRTEAAALYGLFRNTGTSLSIAIFTALLAHNIQVNHEEIGSRFGSTDTPFILSRMLGGTGMTEKIAAFADAEVNRQAMMVAYLDDFWLMMWMVALMLPVLLLMRPMPPARATSEPIVAE